MTPCDGVSINRSLSKIMRREKEREREEREREKRERERGGYTCTSTARN
jgi:hypothetical protein